MSTVRFPFFFFFFLTWVRVPQPNCCAVAGAAVGLHDPSPARPGYEGDDHIRPPFAQLGTHPESRQANGDLLYEFTVESGDFVSPYGGEYTWPRTENRLFEYACHEGNYAMGNILRGARLLESESR